MASQEENCTGFAPNGQVVARYSITSGTYQNTTTTIPFSTSAPTNTQGIQLLTIVFTPQSATNILVFRAQIPFLSIAERSVALALFLSTDTNARAVSRQSAYINRAGQAELYYSEVAGSTSALTYNLRGGPCTATTTYFCGDNTSRLFGGIWVNKLYVWELTP